MLHTSSRIFNKHLKMTNTSNELRITKPSVALVIHGLIVHKILVATLSQNGIMRRLGDEGVTRGTLLNNVQMHPKFPESDLGFTIFGAIVPHNGVMVTTPTYNPVGVRILAYNPLMVPTLETTLAYYVQDVRKLPYKGVFKPKVPLTLAHKELFVRKLGHNALMVPKLGYKKKLIGCEVGRFSLIDPSTSSFNKKSYKNSIRSFSILSNLKKDINVFTRPIDFVNRFARKGRPILISFSIYEVFNEGYFTRMITKNVPMDIHYTVYIMVKYNKSH